MSFDLDFTQIWSQASDMVNMLWPVFTITLGMVLGIGILNFIVKTIKGALGGIR
jgi:hypothetical protein